MKQIDFEKCEKIYKELEEKHRNFNIDTFPYNSWTSSARKIEADLYETYRLTKQITYEEKMYIFGMVCSDALFFSKGDFWRV